MTSDWIAGGFALGGVVIGGLLTSGADALRGWRANRARAKMASRQLRRQLLTVARSISMAVNEGTWGPTRSLETPAWDQYADVFALALRATEWARVSSYIEQLRTIDMPVVELHAPDWRTETTRLPVEVVAAIQSGLEQCRAAYTALHRISDEPKGVREMPALNQLVTAADSEPALEADETSHE